jgi:hypothetical protein
MVGANAVLTMIQGPGTIDAYGDTATDGAALWEGRAAGYLKRQQASRRDVNGNQTDNKADRFILLNSTGAAIVEQAGPDWTSTVVTIEDRRTLATVTKTFRVLEMENRAAGLAVDSVALTLQET